MKKSLFLTLIGSCLSLLLLDGCKKNSGDVWDDSTSMGNYKRARERVLWGASDTDVAVAETKSFTSSIDDDFVPLQDEDLKGQFSEVTFMQPKNSPGEVGSSIPGISGFEKPMGSLSAIFKPIHFNTDEYSLKNDEALSIINRIASYLKEHRGTYIFVEGHCDRRGPEAYNQSLGSKRANAVRTQLIQQGVNPEQIYTVSYGKERPENPQNNPEAWAQNRRAQFKLYTQH